MQILRFCRSCLGPRPRVARRCPWCLKDYNGPAGPPEHLFATFDMGSAGDRGRDALSKERKQ